MDIAANTRIADDDDEMTMKYVLNMIGSGKLASDVCVLGFKGAPTV